MTIKEDIIKKAIAKIKKDIERIDSILDATPLQNIIKIRQEAQNLLNQNRLNDAPTKDFMDKLKILSEKEQYEFKIAEKQKNRIALIGKKVKLDNELGALNSELFFLNRQNFKQ